MGLDKLAVCPRILLLLLVVQGSVHPASGCDSDFRRDGDFPRAHQVWERGSVNIWHSDEGAVMWTCDTVMEANTGSTNTWKHACVCVSRKKPQKPGNRHFANFSVSSGEHMFPETQCYDQFFIPNRKVRISWLSGCQEADSADNNIIVWGGETKWTEFLKKKKMAKSEVCRTQLGSKEPAHPSTPFLFWKVFGAFLA